MAQSADYGERTFDRTVFVAMPKAAVIGNTSWGSTLAWLLSQRDIATTVLVRSEAEARALSEEKRSYAAVSQAREAIDGADLVVWAVPSQRLRENIGQTKDYLTDSMLLMSAAKGLERESTKTMSQVMAEEVGPRLERRVCVLSGPNLAREIAKGLPATSVVAAQDIAVAEAARELLESPTFLLVTTDDVVGVELCGALKNIMALGAGMIDELGLGNNAKGTFITWGWDEAVTLGLALGARAGTFTGLAGVGDLIATCSSNLSRNHFVGCELARGRSLSDISAGMPQVAEGVTTTFVAYKLAETLGLNLPVIELIYRVLFEGLPPGDSFVELQRRIAKQHQLSADAARTSR